MNSENIQKLLELMRQNPKESYHQIIEEENNYESLYHLSGLRRNLVDWIPFEKTEAVLEIGSESGILTEAIAPKVARIDCVEPDGLLVKINRLRNENCDNVVYYEERLTAAADHLNLYDTVLLAGVMERAQDLTGDAGGQRRILELAWEHLRPQGRVILAAENRLGLRYWAGCPDKYSGRCFEGLENYGAGRGGYYSKTELESILHHTGFSIETWYYPYPDYQFPTMIYSQDYLPSPGELHENIRNFDYDRYQLFDEQKVFDSIIKEGSFPLLSNSFLVIAVKG